MSTMKTKLSSRKGMSLGEMLVAVLLVLLVSAGLVAGVALSQRRFVSSLRQSEAQELYSSLSSLISNELRYTTNVYYVNGSSDEVVSFYSVTYAIKEDLTKLVALDSDGNETEDYGELALGVSGNYHRLLGSASYSNDLGAKANVTYDEEKKLFTVTLDVGVKNGNSILSQTFQVRALNDFDPHVKN